MRILLFFSLFFLSKPIFAVQTFSYVLNFVDEEGEILNINRNLDTVTVRLYDHLTSLKTPSYIEYFRNVETVNGRLELEIGINPADDKELPDLITNCYIEVSVRTAVGQAEQLLQPRQALISVPIALTALNAQKLGGHSYAELHNEFSTGSSGELISFSNPSVRVGIGTTEPVSKLHVEMGAVCVSEFADECKKTVSYQPGSINAKFSSVSGLDYAEYFYREDGLQRDLLPGDLIGINPVNGKVRLYQTGDNFLGIVSSNPGVIGNAGADLSKHVLVGLLGQLPFCPDQVNIKNGLVLTKDGLLIGYLLHNNHVYLPGGLRQRLGFELPELKRQNKLLLQQLQEIKEQNELLLHWIENLESANN